MPNPPPRVKDLGKDDVLRFQCQHCNHSAFVLPVRLASLKVPVRGDTPVLELGPRGRCTTCKKRSPLGNVQVIRARQ
jgi:hypothetical protein